MEPTAATVSRRLASGSTAYYNLHTGRVFRIIPQNPVGEDADWAKWNAWVEDAYREAALV